MKRGYQLGAIVIALLLISILVWGGMTNWKFFPDPDPDPKPDPDPDPKPDPDPEPDPDPSGMGPSQFLKCNLFKINLSDSEIQLLQDYHKDFLETISNEKITSCDKITGEIIATAKSLVEPVYEYKNPSETTTRRLSSPGELYCGMFGKQKTVGKNLNVTQLGCECDPVEIPNGSFDTSTCDYTCDYGYEKWFNANGTKYLPDQGLIQDIETQGRYMRSLPDGEQYCIPLTGTVKSCGKDFDKTKYKQAYQVYQNEAWSDDCYAQSVDDCQDGLNFQSAPVAGDVGRCVSHVALCNPARVYPEGDPCYRDPDAKKYDYVRCTLEECDPSTCKESRFGRFSSIEECQNGMRTSLAELKKMQTTSTDDKRVTITTIDGKPCKNIPYGGTCGDDVTLGEFYITPKDENGTIGLYVMDNNVKNGCSARDGFMCSSSIDISQPENRFKIDGNKLLYVGNNNRPPKGPKICGYSGDLGIYCPARYNNPKELKIST